MPAAGKCVRDGAEGALGAPATFFFAFFHIHLATDSDFSLSRFVDIEKVVFIDDNSAGREIRSLDIAHQLFGGYFRILNIGLHGINDFAEIMRWNRGCHTDCNTFRTVD